MIAHLLTMCLTVYFKPIGETLHRKKKIPFKTWLLVDNAPGHIRSLLEAGCWCWFSCSVVSDSGDSWTIAPQAPLSMGFSRQEYWSGLSFPSPGGLPNPGIKLRSPALQTSSLQLSYQGSLSERWVWYKVEVYRSLSSGLSQTASDSFITFKKTNLHLPSADTPSPSRSSNMMLTCISRVRRGWSMGAPVA